MWKYATMGIGLLGISLALVYTLRTTKRPLNSEGFAIEGSLKTGASIGSSPPSWKDDWSKKVAASNVSRFHFMFPFLELKWFGSVATLPMELFATNSFGHCGQCMGLMEMFPEES